MRRATLDDLDSINEWGKADFTEFLANGLNVCLIEGNGGALFAWRGPGIYEAHAFFEQRGREVLNLSHRMLEYMRQKHGAWLFWSIVPTQTRHARMYCRLLGWKSHGIVQAPQGECEIFASENVKCLQP